MGGSDVMMRVPAACPYRPYRRSFNPNPNQSKWLVLKAGTL